MGWHLSDMLSVCMLVLLFSSAHAQSNINVVQMVLAYSEEHTFIVNSTTEYIFEFIPSNVERYPSRLWVLSEGGDTARPLLITTRQTNGAVTWQLPYHRDEELVYELERTLCPPGASAGDAGGDACGDSTPHGGFSLHAGTTCAGAITLRLRADLVWNWRLPFNTAVVSHATPASPSVFFYGFEPDQTSVRLTVESNDDLCATISIQNYSCPVPQSLSELASTGQRMTMLRSAANHVKRSQYPLGFFVVAVLHDSERDCVGDAEAQDQWLWEAAFIGNSLKQSENTPQTKRLDFVISPTLTRAQYAVASGVTVALFALVYLVALVLILAQRWKPFGKIVSPKAVLAKTNTGNEAGQNTPDGVTSVDGAHAASFTRTRSSSVATLDQDDNSDSEDEDEEEGPRAPQLPLGMQTGAGGQATSEQSPEQPPLRLARLARRRAATLRARSDRYLHTVLIVAVFYALPVVQFVAAFQIVMNVSGALDVCYYNFLCAHPAGALRDFNHVLSNAGYLLLGALLLLQLRRRARRRRTSPRDQEYGIPAHYGLLATLGVGMMVVALLSASYHVCPNQLNFQFDTAFMYVLGVISSVKIYQSRHPDVNARAHATFGVLAVIIAIVVWGVLGGGAVFWAAFTVTHIFTFLLLSLKIYYLGQFQLNKWSAAARAMVTGAESLRPLNTPRLVMLLIANLVNWAFALYGLVTQPSDFAGHMLSVVLCNALLHMLFYLSMKLAHGERPRWYAWAFLAAAVTCWAPALYWFVSGSSDWSATPAVSRLRNHECVALQFYDSHDLWHFASAFALFFSFNVLLTWDDGLAAVPREQIPVF